MSWERVKRMLHLSSSLDSETKPKPNKAKQSTVSSSRGYERGRGSWLYFEQPPGIARAEYGWPI
jgi:hypothetical protein